MKSAAQRLIEDSICEIGLLASPVSRDNYRRVWSRDSAMAGMAGWLHGNERIVDAWNQSLVSLAKGQSPTGAIPSNVQENSAVSYGSLVGRVDASTWWAWSVGILKGEGLLVQGPIWEQQLEDCFHFLESIEFNARGLSYVPLGGNWADEYVTQGYTLYDNVLKYAALQAAGRSFHREDWSSKAERLKSLLQLNFSFNGDKVDAYHPGAYERQMAREPSAHWPASLNANGYDNRFDLAGNALSQCLGLQITTKPYVQHLKSLQEQLGTSVWPAFYPIIEPHHADWALLESNYSYTFKNHPHCFHNGGAWPIMMGWQIRALRHCADTDIQSFAQQSFEAMESVMLGFGPEKQFSEFVNTRTQQPGGVSELCFSAAGYLLAHPEANGKEMGL